MGSSQSKRSIKTDPRLDNSLPIGQINRQQLLNKNNKRSRQLLLKQSLPTSATTTTTTTNHLKDRQRQYYPQPYDSTNLIGIRKAAAHHPHYPQQHKPTYFAAQSYQNLYRSSSVSPLEPDESIVVAAGAASEDEDLESDSSRSFLNYPIYLPGADQGPKSEAARLFQRQPIYSTSQPQDLYAVSKGISNTSTSTTSAKPKASQQHLRRHTKSSLQQHEHRATRTGVSNKRLHIRQQPRRLHSSEQQLILERPNSSSLIQEAYDEDYEHDYYENDEYTTGEIDHAAAHYYHPTLNTGPQAAHRRPTNRGKSLKGPSQQRQQQQIELEQPFSHSRASRHNHHHMSGAVVAPLGRTQRSSSEQTRRQQLLGVHSSHSSTSQYSSQSSASTCPLQETAGAVEDHQLEDHHHYHRRHHHQQQQQQHREGIEVSVKQRVEGLVSSSNSNVNSVVEPKQPPKSNHQQAKKNMLPANEEKGLAFTSQERQKLALTGLPAAQQSQELQIRAVLNFIDKCAKDELAAFVYLRNLKDFNERLFYAALSENVERLMPLVYTPTVGLGCQRFSEIYMRPRGLFVNAQQAGHISQVLNEWPERDVRVIVVTDGERILGLGDLGANGMGISIGKLSLYTALAGIPPKNVLPITLDVGTNNQQLLDDPLYIGLKQSRIRGETYEQFVDEFMRATVAKWGRTCLIQFEDFANSNAFTLLQRYRDHYCTFNDDIQGTASVCLSGLISAARQAGKRLSDSTFLFYGAGEANLGTAKLIIMAMQEEGASHEEAQKRVWLVDSKGLVVSERTDLSSHKRALAQSGPQIAKLEPIIEHVKPQAIIGASAQSGAFTESICKMMAKFNERPIIFALSNPTSKAECTAQQAYDWTDGRCVFASGSPFEPVQYAGKTYITGQGNNAYIFPAVGLAAIAAHTHSIPEEAFLVAARALSDQVQASDAAVGLVYPSLSRIREVILAIATRVIEYFYTERLATYRPEPDDKLSFLKEIQYDYRYPATTSDNNNHIN